MKGLFCPASIVVVGVSESGSNLGKNIVANLINYGYQGRIYAVGSLGGEVFGHRVYQSVAELPGNVELAVILTPARFVHEVLAQCGEKGACWAVIECSGFRESGTEGETLERELLKASKRFGIRFVGPNCVGTVNTANGLDTSFIDVGSPYRRGKVGIFTQSGGIGISLISSLSCSGVGISKFVSMGNKLDIDEADYLAYLMDDPETAVIYFYLEDFKRGRYFADLARRCSKPVLLHKSNTGAMSLVAAQSHTAALAADDQVVDSVCRESGILRVRSMSEGICAAKGLCLPPLKGKNLAILSRSGGHSIVAADACARYGFHLPPLARDVLNEAQSRSRAGIMRLGNPMDMGDIFDISFYTSIGEKVLSQHDIDGVVLIDVCGFTNEREATRRLVEDLSALSRRLNKPVAIVMTVPFEERVRLEKCSDFPFFLDPTEAVQALAAGLQWSQTAALSRVKPKSDATAAPVQDALTIPVKDIEKWFGDIGRENRQPLLHEALELLELIGIPAAPWRMAKSLDEALEAAENPGFPVALKAVSPSLLHKSDRSAIALNVRDARSLRNEWHRLRHVSNDISGIVVQKMAEASRELVIGGKRDPSFGPVVLIGLGGIMVEVMKDVSMRLAPIDTNVAMEMLGELSGKRILGQFRGMREADVKAAARILVQVSLLMHHFPQIGEMDLNPVSLNDDGSGAVALDARVLLGPLSVADISLTRSS
ncbi:MAG: acetate--CoA ligase family protein [Anaerolineaceae bacterium]